MLLKTWPSLDWGLSMAQWNSLTYRITFILPALVGVLGFSCFVGVAVILSSFEGLGITVLLSLLGLEIAVQVRRRGL